MNARDREAGRERRAHDHAEHLATPASPLTGFGKSCKRSSIPTIVRASRGRGGASRRTTGRPIGGSLG